MGNINFFLLIVMVQLYLLQNCLAHKKEDKSRKYSNEWQAIPTLSPIPDYGAIIKETQERIERLEASLKSMEFTILKRIINLETSHYNAVSERVTWLESRVDQLKGQMSQFTSYVDEQLAGREAKLTEEVCMFSQALNKTRIETWNAITSLEMGKVQKLLNQDEVWRKNFRGLKVTINQLAKREFKG